MEAQSDDQLCYYVSRSGESRGPTTLRALRALIKAGVPDVSEDTLVFLNGDTEWKQYQTVMDNIVQQEIVHDHQDIPAEEDENYDEDEAFHKEHNESALKVLKSSNKKSKAKRVENTSVYIKGLPTDTTEDELAQFFARCGILKKENNKPRVKLYLDHDTGKPKGDALVTYVLPESVFLAIQRYDDSNFRDDHRISVEEAQFQKSASNGKGTVKNGLNKPTENDEKISRAKRARRLQERAMLSWNEDSFNTKETALLIVVLKGMFLPEDLTKGGDAAIRNLEEDIVEGLESICPNGDEVKKVTIFKSHPEGVVLIRFRDALLAQECVNLMNGRYFDGRQISATLWDGVTEYAPRENAEAKMIEQMKRMEAYDEWLEGQNDDGENSENPDH